MRPTARAAEAFDTKRRACERPLLDEHHLVHEDREGERREGEVDAAQA